MGAAGQPWGHFDKYREDGGAALRIHGQVQLKHSPVRQAPAHELQTAWLYRSPHRATSAAALISTPAIPDQMWLMIMPGNNASGSAATVRTKQAGMGSGLHREMVLLWHHCSNHCLLNLPYARACMLAGNGYVCGHVPKGSTC